MAITNHYRLTAPDTILDGRYKKTPGDDKDVAGDQVNRAMLQPTHIRTLCAWADHDTVGTVSLADASFARYGRDIPLNRAAELTAGLRQDTRTPVPR
ncbi:hypothetical protein [Streptomyces sp. NPDC000405]|uniref:hypothetical protein n=1 Tax=Streptomyces sp. NPDC000405 TaxID=3161033 RepID=UPI00398D2A8E